MERVELPPKFVIPGGTELSAALDLARAILRRAERRVATLAAADELASTAVLAYLNRAADLVYAMARFTDVADPALFEGRGGEGAAMMRATARRRRASPTSSRSTGTRSPSTSPRGRRRRLGPSPTRLLAASLASCTAVTVALYADRKGWNVHGLVVDVDFAGPPRAGERARFDVEVTLPDGLDAEQRERVMVIAGKCPVHRILSCRCRGRDHGARALMDLGLGGRACVVTGAGRGIGRATARMLCEAGGQVLLVARTEDELADAAAECGRAGAPATAAPDTSPSTSPRLTRRADHRRDRASGSGRST